MLSPGFGGPNQSFWPWPPCKCLPCPRYIRPEKGRNPPLQKYHPSPKTHQNNLHKQFCSNSLLFLCASCFGCKKARVRTLCTNRSEKCSCKLFSWGGGVLAEVGFPRRYSKGNSNVAVFIFINFSGIAFQHTSPKPSGKSRLGHLRANFELSFEAPVWVL